MNENDICEGYDDLQNEDEDAFPDDCDVCPNDAEDDADGDGLCADVDACDYDADNDVFLPPKPYSKWILDESTWSWKAPTDYPDDGKQYTWNDNKGEWEEVTE